SSLSTTFFQSSESALRRACDNQPEINEYRANQLHYNTARQNTVPTHPALTGWRPKRHTYQAGASTLHHVPCLPFDSQVSTRWPEAGCDGFHTIHAAQGRLHHKGDPASQSFQKLYSCPGRASPSMEADRRRAPFLPCLH